MPSLLPLRCSLALGAWGWLRKTPDQDYIFQIACSEKVPVLQLYGRYVRAIRCKWIFKSFTLWSSSPPVSLSILSTQVQVEVLPFILTLEYTELLWFLLSLFPSVLFIFFCRKSSVSYLSFFSLSSFPRHRDSSSTFPCTLDNSHLMYQKEGQCRWEMLCVHVYRISQFMAVGFYRDQMCCSHTEPACVPCCISYFSWKHIQSQFCSWNVLHLLWTLLEWRVVVSPYLSWCFRRAIRYKSFCGGGLG